jgi:flagellar P-ring protein precursor FlgI
MKHMYAAMKSRMKAPSRMAVPVLTVLICAGLCVTASAARIRDLCEIQGARDNELVGIGLVVGLAGTGDGASAALTAQQHLLDRIGFEMQNAKDLSSKNSALVMVTATIEAFAKEGIHTDVKVDSIGDAKSLEGGMLLMTQLKYPGDPSETVYAVAQGAVSVGGFNADAGGGTSTRKNHVASGRIPQGATIENEVPSTITDGQRILLLLKKPDFSTAFSVQEAVNKVLGADTALALGGGTVRVTIPVNQRDELVSFIVQLQNIEAAVDVPTRVVLNERTGTIVVGGDVMIKPCHVAHGGLTIKIVSVPAVTPALSFTDANPVITETRDLSVVEEEAFLMPVQGTSAGDVAEALNRLKVTPRDLISIFQALHVGGYLEADLEVM